MILKLLFLSYPMNILKHYFFRNGWHDIEEECFRYRRNQ